MKFYFINNLGDEGEFQEKDIIKAIHKAWNYEANLFKIENNKDKELIFAPFEDNEFNSYLLQDYGIRLIDTEKYRSLQNIKTKEIYKADWED